MGIKMGRFNKEKIRLEERVLKVNWRSRMTLSRFRPAAANHWLDLL